MSTHKSINSFKQGFMDGLPIGLGYLSVSFTFGMMAVNTGFSVFDALLISMTNLTSAGQFAGIGLISSGAPYIEMILTQFIINLRYALMSLSLSQKTDGTFSFLHRLLISFGITDEIFAVASGKPGEIGIRYMYGLISIPYTGWTLGTLTGAGFCTILPDTFRSALSIAIYAMFIAIIIPPAKKSRPVFNVLMIAVALSCIIRYTPFLNRVSGGFAIIICAFVAATIGAKLYPLEEVTK